MMKITVFLLLAVATVITAAKHLQYHQCTERQKEQQQQQQLQQAQYELQEQLH